MKMHDDHSHDLNVKKVDRLSSTRVRLTVEFSSETVTNHEKATANSYAREAKLPGFRPGKAPVKMVTEKYKEDILKDVVNHLVQAGISEALEQTKLTPVNQPRLSKLSEKVYGDNQPLEFQTEFEIQPEIELRHYKGVPLKAEEAGVSEDEVTTTLENIRNRLAILEPLEETKPSQGSFAVVEVGFELVEAPQKKEAPKSFTVELGAGKLIPGLESALLEMTVGENAKDVMAKFPDDYDDKSLVGREAIFSCRLLELKKKTLPELNDALAAQLRPGGTVESLTQEIRGNIISVKQEENRRSQKHQVMEYLIANHSFEVPSSLVERQMQSLLHWMAEDLHKRGQKPSSLSEDDVKMIRQRAEQMVRTSLLLKEIAIKEQIEVDEQKLQEKVNALAGQLGKSPEETRDLLDGKGTLERLRDEILTDQVFDFLITNAQRVDSAPRP